MGFQGLVSLVLSKCFLVFIKAFNAAVLETVQFYGMI